ncbi:hypothetical protein LR48_Vigan03g091200 [Vigna angularis]|uniref:Disease resistance R13L4/SHOC-2-like LRR domain-containing protein n=1 Tax=Phaseolus angularis TaxID=3914 RepID=A0A0L9U422_PHAAN|nr:hypothetical protein LR48_Vigan03g091200 [Vigna angularis]
MKQLTTSRRKFHERGRDESFDGELQKLQLVLNNIKDVFVEVKKNEEKLLDTLAENLEVLQLRRWQDSPLHHIEVGSQEFLRRLRTLKQLKYLSLRGMSRIFELPSSITELESLVILDLKACHNLERLPDDISSMKSLTHLIMSECCLLEGMPKGIEKLTNLQRLSINIGSEAVIKDGEFQSLGNFSAFTHVSILRL